MIDDDEDEFCIPGVTNQFRRGKIVGVEWVCRDVQTPPSTPTHPQPRKRKSATPPRLPEATAATAAPKIEAPEAPAPNKRVHFEGMSESAVSDSDSEDLDPDLLKLIQLETQHFEWFVFPEEERSTPAPAEVSSNAPDPPEVSAVAPPSERGSQTEDRPPDGFLACVETQTEPQAAPSNADSGIQTDTLTTADAATGMSGGRPNFAHAHLQTDGEAPARLNFGIQTSPIEFQDQSTSTDPQKGRQDAYTSTAAAREDCATVGTLTKPGRDEVASQTEYTLAGNTDSAYWGSKRAANGSDFSLKFGGGGVRGLVDCNMGSFLGLQNSELGGHLISFRPEELAPGKESILLPGIPRDEDFLEFWPQTWYTTTPAPGGDATGYLKLGGRSLARPSELGFMKKHVLYIVVQAQGEGVVLKTPAAAEAADGGRGFFKETTIQHGGIATVSVANHFLENRSLHPVVLIYFTH